METYFLTNASFRVVATDIWLVQTIFCIFFRDSCQWVFLSRLVETYFWTNPSFQLLLLEKDFLSWGDPPIYLRVFSTSGNCHLHDWKPVSEGRPYSWVVMEANFLASGSYFLPWSQIFFKYSFIPVSANPYFRPKEKVLFTQSFLYLLVETIIYFIYSRVPNNQPLLDGQFFNFFLLRTTSLPPPPRPSPLLLIFSHFCSHFWV